MERYYTNDTSAYAIPVWSNDGREIWDVHYENGVQRFEYHKLHLYECAKHLYGNAPSGTPYGWFRTTRTGKRIIVTV